MSMDKIKSKKSLTIIVFIIVVVLSLLTVTLLFNNNPLKNKNSGNNTKQTNSTITTDDKTNTTKSKPYKPSSTNSTNGTTTKTNNVHHDQSPKNVTIRIDKSTISKSSVSIIITDTNKNHYTYGVKFGIQKKVDGKWTDLEYAINNPRWIAIAYTPNENNQVIQNVNIKEYYGELENGIYRIVKTLYDDNHTNIFSNEFEIK